MIHGRGKPNLWMTGAQCALSLDDPQGNTRYAYLAQECQFEDVAALRDSKDARIFREPPGEFVVLQTWDGPFVFRTKAHVAQSLAYREVYGPISRILVDPVAANYLSFDEAFESISAGTAMPSNLFMHVSWGPGLNLFCKCRYINFPNEDEWTTNRYLQPISGQVCYYENGQFFIGYVACSVVDGSTSRIEFSLRDRVNFFDIARGPRGFRRLAPLLRRFSPIWVHEYARYVTLEGQCRFYTYD